MRRSLEERKSWIPDWKKLANKHELKVLFYGTTIGVREHVAVVFESEANSSSCARQGVAKFIELTFSCIYSRN